MEKYINLLLFSGFFLFTQGVSCQYVLIQENKNWYEAQDYCRQNYVDLATVQSTEDWSNLQEAIQPSWTWTGLYNDINGWRWSYQDEDMTFESWTSGQPNNKFANQECVALDPDRWNDHRCQEEFQFFCFNEKETDSSRYVLITHLYMNWFEARNYCRQHHTDLPTILTKTENDHLVQMNTGLDKVWIGLFRDWWEWSDETTFDKSSMKWLTGQPDIAGQNQPCGAIDPGGMIDDQLCSEALPFICRLRSKKEIVRLEVKSAQNLNDPTVMETILQWMKQKLKDHGIEKDTRLTWRVQADGNVFSPNSNHNDAEEKSLNKNINLNIK